MPTLGNPRRWQLACEARKRFTAELVAKGLKEGHGKFGTVLQRKMRNAGLC